MGVAPSESAQNEDDDSRRYGYARLKLRAFLNRNTTYAEARAHVMACYRRVKAADWATPAEVKHDVRSASIL
jgi:hypothetical protein